MAATWQTVTVPTTGGKALLDMICVGPGEFVAVGLSGKCRTSADGGLTWTSRTMPEAKTYVALAYDGTTVVAVSTNATQRVAISTDKGHTWTAVTAAELNPWNSVASPAAGVFVAVADSGTHRVMKSTDGGLTWATKTAAAAQSWTSVAAASSTFLLAIASGFVMTSSDGGDTWSSGTAPAAFSQLQAGGTSTLVWSPSAGKFLIPGWDTGTGKAKIAMTAAGATYTYLSGGTLDAYHWAVGIIDAPALGGYLTTLPNLASFAGSPTIIGESFDAGATWTADDTTFSSSEWWPFAWDDANGTFVAWDSDITDTMLVGTFPTGSLDSLTPSSGRTSGGTRVTLTGSGFTGKVDGDVTFGGLRATVVVVASDTELACNTPAHALGAVDVIVDGCGTLTGGYTYTSAASLDSLTPPQGPTTGGVTVTLRGHGFTGATAARVTFGGVAVVSLTVVSDTVLTCVPAAHAAGFVDVAVVGCGTLEKAYRYQAANTSRPTVTDTDAANLPPIPESEPTVDPQTGKINQTWLRWLNAIKRKVEAVKAIDTGSIISGVFALAQIPTIPWDHLDPTGSSLADLTTRNASDLTSGTLPMARIPTLVTPTIGSGLFANLPAAPVEGQLAVVTDASTNTWGAVIAGGGALHVLAYYDGSAWTVIGK